MRASPMLSRKRVSILAAVILTLLTFSLVAVWDQDGPTEVVPPTAKILNASDETKAPKPIKSPKQPAVAVPDPCTVKNALTSQFYDLRELAAVEKTVGELTSVTPQPWLARGLDYGGNFTLGVCSPPLLEPKSDDFPDTVNKTDVGAFFKASENTPRVALGMISTRPKFRGRELVLEYTGGDLCPGSDTLRRSALLMMTCDREISSKAKVSYVGSANDCAYFFKVRTIHACAIAPTDEGTGVVPIVFLIGAAAAVTCFGGGLLYTVFRRLGLGQPPRLAN